MPGKDDTTPAVLSDEEVATAEGGAFFRSDVDYTPPQMPATPPGVPIPYPITDTIKDRK